MSIREIAQNFRNFCPKYIPPLNFRVFSLLLQIFLHCFCQNFQFVLPAFRGKGGKQWEIRAKAMEIRAKAMGKFWQKQWENSESDGICFGQKFLLPEFPIAFSWNSHCFCPNVPSLLPEFPTAFARIFRFQKFWGAQCPPCPPPRLLRLC